MTERLLLSYPARLVFLLAAIAAAIVVIQFRIFFIDGSSAIKPNPSRNH